MASFNSLPCEAREAIFACVARASDCRGLSKYVTVSREWQVAIERITFSELSLTPRRLAALNEIAAAPRRRSAVQAINFCVVLDADHETFGARSWETGTERLQSQAVAAAIRRLFAALALWTRRDSPCGIKLRLVATSTSDAAGTTVAVSTGDHDRYEGALQLDFGPVPLPRLDVISGLRWTTGRHINPTSLLALVSRMPNLGSLDVRLNHDSADKQDVLQRTGFLTGLVQLCPAITSLRLRRARTPPGSRSAPPRQPWSPFYDSLRLFSQRCEAVRFDDCVDAMALFAPFARADLGEDHSAPRWPRLEQLRLHNSYMLLPPYLRADGRAEALRAVDSLLVRARRAAARMPRLRKARISQCVRAEAGVEWFVLSYRWLPGRQPVLTVEGFVLTARVLEAWESSIAEVRGLDLAVRCATSDPAVRRDTSWERDVSM